MAVYSITKRSSVSQLLNIAFKYFMGKTFGLKLLMHKFLGVIEDGT